MLTLIRAADLTLTLNRAQPAVTGSGSTTATHGSKSVNTYT